MRKPHPSTSGVRAGGVQPSDRSPFAPSRRTNTPHVARDRGGLLRALRRLVPLAAAALIGMGAVTSADMITVHVVDFDFTDTGPTGIHFDPSIHVGDTVRWVWDEGFHSTTSVAGLAESWDSGVHPPGSPAFTFEHTFNVVGDFAYFCQVHGFDAGDGTAGGMAGVVHVQRAVPEPAGVAMLGLGILGVAFYARRRLRISPRIIDAEGRIPRNDPLDGIS